MLASNDPTTPQTDRPRETSNPGRDRDSDRNNQTSRPDQNRDRDRDETKGNYGNQQKSGRPQDDRDPHSPSRGTQRPDETTNMDDRNTSDGDEDDVKSDMRGASNSGNRQRNDGSSRPL